MPNKIKSRSVSNRLPSAPRAGKPKKLTLGSNAQARAAALLSRDIRFIPGRDFESLTGDSTVIDAAIQFIETAQRQAIADRKALATGSGFDADDAPVFHVWRTEAALLTFDEEQLLFKALNLLRFRVHRMRIRLSPSSPSKRVMDEIDEMLNLVDQIRSQLVNSNLRLVSSIARKFSSQNCDVDDFSSDGCLILLGAIDRFDFSRGFRFSTYATHSVQRHFYRVWRVRQCRKERFPNAGPELLGSIPDQDRETLVCNDPQGVVNNLLARAESILDPREYQIVLSRFGLKSENRRGRTLREIAADMGLSKERVRQLQLKALEKLGDLLTPEFK